MISFYEGDGIVASWMSSSRIVMILEEYRALVILG
jgi:hypothetical protein